MWIWLALISSLFLGIYDLFKKASLTNNAVLPVLFFSCLSASFVFMPLSYLSHAHALKMKDAHLYIPDISLNEHLLILIKSFIVVSSWTFSFFALKNLPLTIVSPIRSTGPLWTLIGAIVIFSEQLTLLQWVGISITLISFYLFSTVGKLEGIHFKKNRWIWFIVCATLLGSVSGLYDKYLLRQLDRMAVQAWFTYYQVLILLPVVMIWWYPKRSKIKFVWRSTIPFIGFFLVLADFAYFYALSYPDSLISMISAIRRAGVVLPFLGGAIVYKEKNILLKGIFLTGIVVGVFFLLL